MSSWARASGATLRPEDRDVLSSVVLFDVARVSHSWCRLFSAAEEETRREKAVKAAEKAANKQQRVREAAEALNAAAEMEGELAGRAT